MVSHERLVTPAFPAVTADPLAVGHVSSAIPSLTVANIRRGLGEIRTRWSQSSPDNPLFICDGLQQLQEGLTVQDFASQFVLGQHLKRHAKSNVQRAAIALLQTNAEEGHDSPDGGSGEGGDSEVAEHAKQKSKKSRPSRRAVAAASTPLTTSITEKPPVAFVNADSPSAEMVVTVKDPGGDNGTKTLPPTFYVLTRM